MQRADWRPTVDKGSVAVISVVQGEQMAAVCDNRMSVYGHPTRHSLTSSASRQSMHIHTHTHTRVGQGVVILLQAFVTCYDRMYYQ